jgi:hypothetical protein
MMSVTAEAGETKPIAAAAAASCRYLNADFTTPPLSPLLGRNLYIFYIPAPWDRRDSSSFRAGRPAQTIDDHRGVGNS